MTIGVIAIAVILGVIFIVVLILLCRPKTTSEETDKSGNTIGVAPSTNVPEDDQKLNSGRTRKQFEVPDSEGNDDIKKSPHKING